MCQWRFNGWPLNRTIKDLARNKFLSCNFYIVLSNFFSMMLYLRCIWIVFVYEITTTKVFPIAPFVIFLFDFLLFTFAMYFYCICFVFSLHFFCIFMCDENNKGLPCGLLAPYGAPSFSSWSIHNCKPQLHCNTDRNTLGSTTGCIFFYLYRIWTAFTTANLIHFKLHCVWNTERNTLHNVANKI